jgi:undecaprenyl-diphosphatase
MSMVAYGFLAVLVARAISSPKRWIVYAAAAFLILMIAFSRLYLGAHWPSDVVGGLSLGLAFVCALSIAHYQHASPAPRGIAVAALVALSLGGGWHVFESYSADLERYAYRAQTNRMDADAWWTGNWRELPAYRLDLEGDLEQPLNVQWAGPLETLHQRLLEHGWQQAVEVDSRSVLRWLEPDPAIETLPMLPQVHDGRHETLRMVYPLGDDSEQVVLRLWDTGTRLDPGGRVLWAGTVSVRGPGHILMLTLPVERGKFQLAIDRLKDSLDAGATRTVIRAEPAETGRAAWNGRVLLARDA